jgi:ATP-binding cassette subfamily B protein
MGTFRRLLTYLTNYRVKLLVVLLCIVVANALTMVAPLFVQQIFDVFLPQGDVPTLTLFAVAIIGAMLASGGLNYVLRYVNESVSQRSVYDLRNDLYEALLGQSFSFYDRSRTGQLISRATGDIRQIQRFFSWGLRAMVDTFLTFAIAFAVLVSINWQLTVLSFLTAPLISFILSRYARKIGPIWEAIRAQYGNINAVIQENLMGVRVVKGFAAEDREIAKFAQENRVYMDRVVAQARLSAFYRPLADVLANVNFLLILGYGGIQVIGGALTFGAWTAYNLYAMRLLRPVRFLGFITTFYKRATAAGARVFEIMDAQPDVQEAADAADLEDVAGEVRFERVSFGYDPDQLVLKEVTLTVRPGETVAILGSTGSGKSSFINLIPRFYDVTAGRIAIDGRDVRTLTLASLRRKIAIVQQEPFIFSTSLKANIAYGKDDVTEEAIVKAAKAAHLHAFIASLPQGYDTPVGERGVTLSGGQKQRLAIARALLTEPQILIFDASTSNVDTETEHEIQRALDTMLNDRTTFIITQRLSTVKGADTIVVLERGEIVEQGTHTTLMARRGYYYRLYQTQLQEQLGADAPDAPGGRG